MQAFMDKGEDFIVRDRLDDLVPAMNALTGENRLSVDHLREQIEARDREIDQSLLEGCAGNRHPRGTILSRRPAAADRQTAPPARPQGRAADCRAGCIS
ncbi:hypothetical protein [Ensifer canadensis]